MKPVSIAAFDILLPAEALIRELTARGIEAGLDNETVDQSVRFFTRTKHAQFRVVVPEEEVMKALGEFAKIAPKAEGENADCPVTHVIRCPSCGSTLVEYPQFSRKTIVGALPSLAASAGLIEQTFFCRECNYTWEPTSSGKPDVSDAIV